MYVQYLIFIINTDQAQINSATVESIVLFCTCIVQYMWYISGGQFVHSCNGGTMPMIHFYVGHTANLGHIRTE